MLIADRIEIIDLALFLKKHNTLIFSDTQIGYEESLNKKGVMVPRFQLKDMLERMKNAIKIAKPEKIIINGDIKHEFSRISKTEWRYTVKLIQFLSKHSELVLIRGNHDTFLDPIAKKKGIKLIDHLKIDDIYICHGHKIPKNEDFKNSKIVIIGHEHPAVGLREKTRVERYKCFLKGKYKDKTLIVQPSSNLITEGTDVLKEQLLSPFLKKTKLDNFEVFVVADDVLYFGNVKGLL